MKNKRMFIIFGAIGIVFVLIWIAIIVLVVKTLRGSLADKTETPVVEAALCSENADNLCIINFGTNNLNRMVINFRLPGKGYDAFYVKAKNRDTVGVYTCEVDESDLTIAHCTGLRTPLGETIDIEAYTTDGDILIARGTFLVSALAIPTPISLPTEAPTEEPVATEGPFPTEEPYMTEEPFITEAPFYEGEPTLPPEGESTPDPSSLGQ